MLPPSSGYGGQDRTPTAILPAENGSAPDAHAGGPRAEFETGRTAGQRRRERARGGLADRAAETQPWSSGQTEASGLAGPQAARPGGQRRPGPSREGPNRSHSPGRSLQQQRRTEPGIQNGGGAAAAPILQAEGSAYRLAPLDPAGPPDRGRERGRAGFGGNGAGMTRGRCSTAGGGTENATRTTFLGGSTRDVGPKR